MLSASSLKLLFELSINMSSDYRSKGYSGESSDRRLHAEHHNYDYAYDRRHSRNHSSRYERSRNRSRSSSSDWSRSSRHRSYRRSRSREHRNYDDSDEGYSKRSPFCDEDNCLTVANVFKRTYESNRPRYRYANIEPNSTLVVKGIPLSYNEELVRNAVVEMGVTPIDVRILRRRESGESRGFGFIEFMINGRRMAEVQYSINKNTYPSATFVTSQRGGDWICGKCTTNNFKKRDHCFKCGVRREDSDPVCGDGINEIGVMPCDTLLFRNLPYSLDEVKLTDHLNRTCAMTIQQVLIARNVENGFSRGYAYVQMTSVNDAAQLLTTLTAVSKLIIDGREILVSYSKIPLSTVIAETALTRGGSNLNPSNSNYFSSGGTADKADMLISQTDYTNAAAAVAQSAIKKAQVLRQAVTQVTSAALLESGAEYKLQNTAVLMAGGGTQNEIGNLSKNAPSEESSVVVPQSSDVSLGTVDTAYGKLQRYPAPNVSQFQYDQTSGYYYDPTTGLYYDSNSQYFYNNTTQQFLYWDSSYQTYLPVVSSQGEDAGVGEESSTTKDKKTAKPKQEKVKVAKKIQKDMEKWAKALNHRKEAVLTTSSSSSTKVVVAPEVEAAAVAANLTISAGTVGADVVADDVVAQSSSAANAAYTMLERTADPEFQLDHHQVMVIQQGANVTTSDVENPPKKSTSVELNFLKEPDVDWEKLVCLLCRRQFPTKDMLEKHQRLSEMHKSNLAEKQGKLNKSRQLSASSAGTTQYRDRASERRAKFGLDDQPHPNKLKEKFLESLECTAVATHKPAVESIGSRLMRNMGWKEGQGLGKSNQGITNPIESERRVQGAGLGAPGSVYKANAGASYKEHVKAALRQKIMSSTRKVILNKEQIPVNKMLFCSLCKGKLYAPSAYQVNGRIYHTSCVVCFNCRQDVSESYHTVGRGIFCTNCYQEIYSPICFQCSNPILNNQSVIVHNCVYHTECLECPYCNKRIVLSEEITKNNHWKLKCESCEKFVTAKIPFQ
ncbi:RNA-binding protein 5 [Trichinella britovi]|uniref:RNA-binding protein 5 n=1 Tax=Trichinella britovi TaxID=45882 RepID=A0A0V1DAR1_TRIBR|nr:RNA-binding protein 5 [Trichinella britovi]